MRIVSPYVTDDYEVKVECGLSQIDKVERSGYVSPDKKIQSYIESGILLQSFRSSGPEYEIQGEESDLEEDDPEFADELTEDAENYKEAPLPQFIDKMSAVETLNEFEKTYDEHDSESKAKSKKANDEETARKKSLNDLGETIAKSIVKAEEEKAKSATQ